MSDTHSIPPPSPQLIEESLHAQRNRRLLIVALVLSLTGLAYGGHWWTTARHWIQTDNAYVTGNLVPVTAQAGGIITQVLFEETQFVNRGDVLVRLDENEAYCDAGTGARSTRRGGPPHQLALLYATATGGKIGGSQGEARRNPSRHEIGTAEGFPAEPCRGRF